MAGPTGSAKRLHRGSRHLPDPLAASDLDLAQQRKFDVPPWSSARIVIKAAFLPQSACWVANPSQPHNAMSTTIHASQLAFLLSLTGSDLKILTQSAQQTLAWHELNGRIGVRQSN